MGQGRGNKEVEVQGLQRWSRVEGPVLCLGLSNSLLAGRQREEWHKEVTGKVPDLKEQVAKFHGWIECALLAGSNNT
jgi:hypothetical protein